MAPLDPQCLTIFFNMVLRRVVEIAYLLSKQYYADLSERCSHFEIAFLARVGSQNSISSVCLTKCLNQIHPRELDCITPL